MMRPKKQNEPSGPTVPAYIVTFSDMVTLLLTFFVMLLSMADVQMEKHRFASGRSSVQKALADFGLSGFLINQNSGPDFQHPQSRHSIEDGQDEPDDRSVDAQTEMLRRVMFEIETLMKISPSQIDGFSPIFLPMELQFSPGSWNLDNTGKEELDRFYHQLQSSMGGERPMLYVLGVASDEPDVRSKWIVSARRAQSVKDYIGQLQNEAFSVPVFCWGAGGGGEWTGKSGLTNPKTQIVIAVIEER